MRNAKKKKKRERERGGLPPRMQERAEGSSGELARVSGGFLWPPQSQIKFCNICVP